MAQDNNNIQQVEAEKPGFRQYIVDLFSDSEINLPDEQIINGYVNMFKGNGKVITGRYVLTEATNSVTPTHGFI
jgi:hypothetical protein